MKYKNDRNKEFNLEDSDITTSYSYSFFKDILINLLFCKYGYYENEIENSTLLYVKKDFEMFLNFLCEKHNIEFEISSRYKTSIKI